MCLVASAYITAYTSEEIYEEPYNIGRYMHYQVFGLRNHQHKSEKLKKNQN